MKEKLHNDMFRVGEKSVDHWNINAIEAVTMTVVSILSVTLGTIYGTLLF